MEVLTVHKKDNKIFQIITLDEIVRDRLEKQSPKLLCKNNISPNDWDISQCNTSRKISNF